MWKFLTSSRSTGTELPSPGGQYVAVLGPPQEVWGSYLTTLALWTAAPHQLVYYRAGYAAHSLDVTPIDTPTFLYWSDDGKWLTFYEFKRQAAYQLAFVEVAAGLIYRLPASDELLQQLPQLSQSSAQLAAFLQQTQVSGSPLVADDAPDDLRPR